MRLPPSPIHGKGYSGQTGSDQRTFEYRPLYLCPRVLGGSKPATLGLSYKCKLLGEGYRSRRLVEELLLNGNPVRAQCAEEHAMMDTRGTAPIWLPSLAVRRVLDRRLSKEIGVPRGRDPDLCELCAIR